MNARAGLAAAEKALARALGVHGEAPDITGCERDCPLEAELAGRCVLCVGGRSGLVDGYRKLVEYRGGRFLHHDGGQEESLHRIATAIVSADAVVCQTACVSHAAYWRLKDACKKLGKPLHLRPVARRRQLRPQSFRADERRAVRPSHPDFHLSIYAGAHAFGRPAHRRLSGACPRAVSVIRQRLHDDRNQP